jgi:spoIIIJ-associated protein
MSETQPNLEIIAPSVEEAVARGAAELGLPEDQLEVEVLDEGSRGVLGVGSRQARVRLKIRGARSQPPQPEPQTVLRMDIPADQSTPSESSAFDDVDVDDQEVPEITQAIVEELLTRMGVDGLVKSHWGEPDAPGKVRPLLVDIHGDDLSLLIGRRGETLSALQYVTRLIVGKELHKPVAIVIDVEGYRARREETLRRLARRMAEQAIDRQRTMSLEPMPANERRIIHLELKENPKVTTESVGEGNHRKVTIIPQD